MSGDLFIISAPSGTGKTTLAKQLVANDADMMLSVSHTTRPKRPNELEGRDYHFVTDDAFETLVQNDAFLEHAQVFGHRYGTARDWVAAQLKTSDVLLEIDYQGAVRVMKAFPAAISIFLFPPSIATLETRLNQRSTEAADVIAKRLTMAKNELEQRARFGYWVVNDDMEKALADLQAIVKACRLRQHRQQHTVEARLAL